MSYLKKIKKKQDLNLKEDIFKIIGYFIFGLGTAIGLYRYFFLKSPIYRLIGTISISVILGLSVVLISKIFFD